MEKNEEVLYVIEEVSEILKVRPGVIRQVLLDNRIFRIFTEDAGDKVLYGKHIVDPFYIEKNKEEYDKMFKEHFFRNSEGVEQFVIYFKEPSICFIKKLIKEREVYFK